MGKFSVDSVLPLIFRFLVKSGYQKTATKLQKETDIDLSQAVTQDNFQTIPLHKKKLAAIIERYTNDNP